MQDKENELIDEDTMDNEILQQQLDPMKTNRSIMTEQVVPNKNLLSKDQQSEFDVTDRYETEQQKYATDVLE